mmetsp:Transcript_3288/g.9450  ORF Transcript_3288/g.9450 Transcript_3288/m.9450 type:complete len:277 (-) Transcript_3288:168-998(-)
MGDTSVRGVGAMRRSVSCMPPPPPFSLLQLAVDGILRQELVLPTTQCVHLCLAQVINHSREVLGLERRLCQGPGDLLAGKGVGTAWAVEVSPLGDIVHTAADGEEDGLGGVAAVVLRELCWRDGLCLQDLANNGVFLLELCLPLVKHPKLILCESLEVAIDILFLQGHQGQRPGALVACKDVVAAAAAIEGAAFGDVEYRPADGKQHWSGRIPAVVPLQRLDCHIANLLRFLGNVIKRRQRSTRASERVQEDHCAHQDDERGGAVGGQPIEDGGGD